MTNLGTYFYDTEGNRLGIESGILPVPVIQRHAIYVRRESGDFSRC